MSAKPTKPTLESATKEFSELFSGSLTKWQNFVTSNPGIDSTLEVLNKVRGAMYQVAIASNKTLYEKLISIPENEEKINKIIKDKFHLVYELPELQHYANENSFIEIDKYKEETYTKYCMTILSFDKSLIDLILKETDVTLAAS
jgi:hypothetical protein